MCVTKSLRENTSRSPGAESRWCSPTTAASSLIGSEITGLATHQQKSSTESTKHDAVTALGIPCLHSSTPPEHFSSHEKRTHRGRGMRSWHTEGDLCLSRKVMRGQGMAERGSCDHWWRLPSRSVVRISLDAIVKLFTRQSAIRLTSTVWQCQ